MADTGSESPARSIGGGGIGGIGELGSGGSSSFAAKGDMAVGEASTGDWGSTARPLPLSTLGVGVSEASGEGEAAFSLPSSSF